MATPAGYLMTATASDCLALAAQLEQVNKIRNRICQRLLALVGIPPDWSIFSGYSFPNEYSQAKLGQLFNALNDLPGSIVGDDTRDKLFKLLAAFQ